MLGKILARPRLSVEHQRQIRETFPNHEKVFEFIMIAGGVGGAYSWHHVGDILLMGGHLLDSPEHVKFAGDAYSLAGQAYRQTLYEHNERLFSFVAGEMVVRSQENDAAKREFLSLNGTDYNLSRNLLGQARQGMAFTEALQGNVGAAQSLLRFSMEGENLGVALGSDLSYLEVDGPDLDGLRFADLVTETDGEETDEETPGGAAYQSAFYRALDLNHRVGQTLLRVGWPEDGKHELGEARGHIITLGQTLSDSTHSAKQVETGLSLLRMAVDMGGDARPVRPGLDQIALSWPFRVPSDLEGAESEGVL